MSLERGARNLLILGVGSIILTVATTTASLAIYRISGDIYLDRSRPGYLPDEDEVTEENNVNLNYAFPESGSLDAAELDEYLDQLKLMNDRLQNYPDSFSPSPLSDETLNIPSEFKEQPLEASDTLLDF